MASKRMANRRKFLNVLAEDCVQSVEGHIYTDGNIIVCPICRHRSSTTFCVYCVTMHAETNNTNNITPSTCNNTNNKINPVTLNPIPDSEKVVNAIQTAVSPAHSPDLFSPDNERIVQSEDMFADCHTESDDFHLHLNLPIADPIEVNSTASTGSPLLGFSPLSDSVNSDANVQLNVSPVHSPELFSLDNERSVPIQTMNTLADVFTESRPSCSNGSSLSVVPRELTSTQIDKRLGTTLLQTLIDVDSKIISNPAIPSAYKISVLEMAKNYIGPWHRKLQPVRTVVESEEESDDEVGRTSHEGEIGQLTQLMTTCDNPETLTQACLQFLYSDHPSSETPPEQQNNGPNEFVEEEISSAVGATVVVEEPQNHSQTCHICGKIIHSLYPSHMTQHLQTHEGKVQCDSCGNLVAKRSLVRHIKSNSCRKNIENGFICDVCGKSFKSAKTRKQHLKLH